VLGDSGPGIDSLAREALMAARLSRHHFRPLHPPAHRRGRTARVAVSAGIALAATTVGALLALGLAAALAQATTA